MNKYLKINNFYLTQAEIVDKKQVENSSINHIWIYDRSYSMHQDLPVLTEDLINRAKQLPMGDTITIGWFSGEGQFNFILKGFKINNVTDYAILENAIRKNKSPIGCTCFSEILTATDQAVEDLSILNNRFALCFFTDGYPVVSNYSTEIDTIYKVLEKLESKIYASLFVGYGNYYNKDLMAKMAAKLGGSLTHSDNLQRFSITLADFIQSVPDNNKVRISINANENDMIFSINKTGINVYALQKDGSVNFILSKSRGKNYVYTLTTNKPGPEYKEVKLTAANVKNGKQESILKGAYAAAYLCVQKGQADTALEILGTLGDKALIDVISNAFTNDEYGIAERRINEAVISAKKRFINGRDTKYLPKDDAFCLLNVIDLLLTDENVYFYPQNSAFQYKRIGPPSVIKNGYPTFEANSNVKCTLSDLTWSESRLNLSLRVKIPGTIKLKRNYKAKGFKNNRWNTWIWRNYAIVKDGFLNVKILPVSMSHDTWKKLKTEKLIDQDTWSETEVYPVHLDRVPVINRIIANGSTSAKNLCKKVYEAFEIKAGIKALKYLRDQKWPQEKISSDSFQELTNEQIEFLSEHGITNNGFNPPRETLETTDFYYVKEFKIKIAKLSSLPKVDDVIKKVEANKKLTPREKLISDAITAYKGTQKTTLIEPGSNEERALLNQTIKDLQKRLVKISSDVQKTKFAIILGKKWFDEFNSRFENMLEINNVQYTIDLQRKKVEI